MRFSVRGAEPQSLASVVPDFPNLSYGDAAVVWGSLYIDAGMHVHETVYSPRVPALQNGGLPIRNLVSCCFPVELIPSGCARAANGLIGTDYPVQSYIESPISLLNAARDNANNRSYYSVRRVIGAFTNAAQIIAMKFLSKST